MYLAKAAFSQDLVEDKAVHIEAGQMSDARLRSWTGPLPNLTIGSCGSFLKTKHINSLTIGRPLHASLSAQRWQRPQNLCMNQPLTIDVQFSKLANFIVDSDIRKVGQAGVRTTGGRFLVDKKNKTDSLLCFIPCNLCI